MGGPRHTIALRHNLPGYMWGAHCQVLQRVPSRCLPDFMAFPEKHTQSHQKRLHWESDADDRAAGLSDTKSNYGDSWGWDLSPLSGHGASWCNRDCGWALLTRWARKARKGTVVIYTVSSWMLHYSRTKWLRQIDGTCKPLFKAEQVMTSKARWCLNLLSPSAQSCLQLFRASGLRSSSMICRMLHA